eukprot:gb/GFBE01060993.1/.p1 GENE.gb/GFBE01060993.1/~~gb/GFBE01060993.1/.p1  ORF type:complete len:174 (+),score=19.67 gb/GFBE01060993.1/:1-522(+)
MEGELQCLCTTVSKHFGVQICVVSLLSPSGWTVLCQSESLADAVRTATQQEPTSLFKLLLERKAPTVIPDASTTDFAEDPLVVAGPKIRFYAEVPLWDDMGRFVGALILADPQPRSQMRHDDTELLWKFGYEAMQMLPCVKVAAADKQVRSETAATAASESDQVDNCGLATDS